MALEVYKDVPLSNADPSLPSSNASGHAIVWKESCPSSPDAA